MLWPHFVLSALICDRPSMDERGEFLHGDEIGDTHDQGAGRERRRNWPGEIKAYANLLRETIGFAAEKLMAPEVRTKTGASGAPSSFSFKSFSQTAVFRAFLSRAA